MATPRVGGQPGAARCIAGWRAAVARQLDHGAPVLLVGDAQLGGCATVAALHLARASGVSPSATLLSLRNACPAALHHQVDLDALAALAF